MGGVIKSKARPSPVGSSLPTSVKSGSLRRPGVPGKNPAGNLGGVPPNVAISEPTHPLRGRMVSDFTKLALVASSAGISGPTAAQSSPIVAGAATTTGPAAG